MAEFCLKCWNKMNKTHETERDWVLSDELDLCEGCGQICRVIEKERTLKFLYDLKHWKKK